MIRQIKINCKERGDLLEKIWNAYLELFEKVLMKNQHVQQQIETLYLTETSRVHRMYQKEIETIFALEDNLKRENLELAKVALEMKEIYKAGKKEKKASVLSLKLLKKEYEKLSGENKILWKQNQEVIKLLEQEKKEAEEKSVLLEEVIAKKEVLEEEYMRKSIIYMSRSDKECDTQDLTHYYDGETNTEEKYFFFRDLMFNKAVQTVDPKDINRKSVSKDIFDEFPAEKEKYKKRATISSTSWEFFENLNFRFPKTSIDSKRKSSNFETHSSRNSIDNEKKIIPKKASVFQTNMEANTNSNKPIEVNQPNEKILPKYVRTTITSVNKNDKDSGF